jgi:flagellar protein FliJ
MANYHFPLQKVMELKHKQMEELKLKHAECTSIHQVIEKQLADLWTKKKQWEEKSTLTENDFFFVGNLLEINSYLRYLTSQIEDKEKELNLAAEQVRISRLHLTEKMKEFQVWEKWKEKSYETYQEQLNQVEQKELDEMALQIYMRGVKEHG